MTEQQMRRKIRKAKREAAAAHAHVSPQVISVLAEMGVRMDSARNLGGGQIQIMWAEPLRA